MKKIVKSSWAFQEKTKAGEPSNEQNIQRKKEKRKIKKQLSRLTKWHEKIKTIELIGKLRLAQYGEKHDRCPISGRKVM